MPPSSSRRGLLSDTKRDHHSSGSSRAAGPSTSSLPSATPQRKSNKRDRDAGEYGESSTTSGDLPDYEPPSFPLDARARKALSELSSNQDTAGYASQLAASLDKLSDGVRDINDAYTERRTKLRNHQSRRRAAASGTQQQPEEEDEDAAADGEKKAPERAEEKAVMFLKDEVPGLSEQIEAAVREVIDMQTALEDGQTALRDA
ncbi:hypothetical protein Micbo1qcDRAFT_155394, partial [Microdochium bolleyi]